jgi:cytochrome c5
MNLGALALMLVAACGSADGSSHRPPDTPASTTTADTRPTTANTRPAPADTGESAAARDSALMPVGISADSLPDPASPGARLVATYCSSCHGIPSPRRHAAADWPATVRRMELRMDIVGHMGRRMGGGMMGGGGMRGRRMRGGMMGVRAPGAAETAGILSYLESHAMPAADTARLPAASGRALFSRTCSRCHALPAPSQHTAAQWPGVVERMRQHMRQMGVGSITDRQAADIVAYLRRAGS